MPMKVLNAVGVHSVPRVLHIHISAWIQGWSEQGEGGLGPVCKYLERFVSHDEYHADKSR
jgi:hypothetical protein